MEDGIAGLDVREEGIAQALAFVRSLHQARDVDHVQEGGHFAARKQAFQSISTFQPIQTLPCRLVKVAQKIEPLVGHRHTTFVRIDRAERKVFGRRLTLGEHVEES